VRAGARVSRIAVAAGPDAGHAYPALGVAAELRRRGHEVRFYSGPDHRDLATSLGCSFDLLPRLGPTAGDGDLGHRLWRRAADMAAPFADQLRVWRPDLVVSDLLTRCGAFAAQLVELPWVEVVPHHLPDPGEGLPPVGLGRRPARSALRRLDDRRIHAQQLRSYALGAEQAAAAAGTLGLTEVAPPVLRLVATLPSLERTRTTWPSTAHVVGPLAVEPALTPLAPPAGDEPLILVTDSTASGLETSLADVALRGLRYLDVRVVVTSGRVPPRREAGVVVGRGPHGPLLEQASLAISPGGGGFVSKAAAAGVPHVVVPLLGDQREAASRLRDTGAGRTVRPGRLSPRTLRWAVVRHLADPRASEGAARLAAEAAALGPALAGDLVERVLAGERPASSGPDTHLPQGLVDPARSSASANAAVTRSSKPTSRTSSSRSGSSATHATTASASTEVASGSG
jgi:UDP:flavonoid glycosyltransferase YjiC (YdhE family)